jgi:hypothetical protein
VSGDANLCLSLEYTLRSDAEIEIVGERVLDQALQCGILKDHRPLLVGDGRCLRGRRDIGSKCLAIAAWHVDRGPLVVRPFAGKPEYDQITVTTGISMLGKISVES